MDNIEKRLIIRKKSTKDLYTLNFENHELEVFQRDMSTYYEHDYSFLYNLLTFNELYFNHNLFYNHIKNSFILHPNILYLEFYSNIIGLKENILHLDMNTGQFEFGKLKINHPLEKLCKTLRNYRLGKPDINLGLI
jgi:hypothetical protein